MRKGELSNAVLDRAWPHHAVIPADAGGQRFRILRRHRNQWRLNPEFPGRLRYTMNESTGAGAYTDNSGGFTVTILHAEVN